MRFSVISVRSNIGLHQAASLSAAIRGESRHFAAIGGVAWLAGARREGCEDPTWITEISNRTMAGIAWRADGSYPAIDKASLDDPELVGVRLASADRHLISIAVDHEIAMARPLIFRPGLEEAAINSENAAA